MSEDIVQAGSRHVTDVLSINRELSEKAIRMRCLAYYSSIRAKLLTETIFEIDSSKKRLLNITNKYKQQSEIIADQKSSLEEKNLELQKSRYNFLAAQEVAKVGSWYLDLIKNELIWTDENYRIFEIPKGTPMSYEKFIKVVHPDDRAYVDKQWKAAIAGEPYDIEHRLLINDKVKWVREKAELKFNDAKEPISGIGVTQDITIIKQSEEERSNLRAQLIRRRRWML